MKEVDHKMVQQDEWEISDVRGPISGYIKKQEVDMESVQWVAAMLVATM